MKRAILSLLLWPAAIEVAYALDLYVATTGSDVSNNCQIQATPCLTGQHAVDQTVFGSGVGYDIHFADGTYYGAINVAYWRIVNLRGNCSNLFAVSLRPAANGQAIIYAQDGAIVGVNCLELNGSQYSGALGIAARQFSTVDYQWVRFSQMPGG